jgi:hypothetical protein
MVAVAVSRTDLSVLALREVAKRAADNGSCVQGELKFMRDDILVAYSVLNTSV